MLTNQAFYHYMYNPGSVECGGDKRRLDICVCTERLREDLIREEGMKDPYFIKLLNQKLAIELFHFIRDGGRLLRTAYIEKAQKRFIKRHLDFLRAVRFNYYLRKKTYYGCEQEIATRRGTSRTFDRQTAFTSEGICVS